MTRSPSQVVTTPGLRRWREKQLIQVKVNQKWADRKFLLSLTLLSTISCLMTLITWSFSCIKKEYIRVYKSKSRVGVVFKRKHKTKRFFQCRLNKTEMTVHCSLKRIYEVKGYFSVHPLIVYYSNFGAEEKNSSERLLENTSHTDCILEEHSIL